MTTKGQTYDGKVRLTHKCSRRNSCILTSGREGCKALHLHLKEISAEACSDAGVGVQIADIWSCGVMVYVMLVGAYPFERPEDKHDNQKLQKMIQVRRFLCLASITL